MKMLLSLELGFYDLLGVIIRKIFYRLAFVLGIEIFAAMVRRPYLIVLAYHRSLKSTHCGPVPYISVFDYNLDEQINYFKNKYDTISLGSLFTDLSDGLSIQKNTICFTFDDGYRDNFEVAAPIFYWHKVPFVIFVATGCVMKKNDLWPDQLRDIIYQNYEYDNEVNSFRKFIKHSSIVSELRQEINVCKSLSRESIENYISARRANASESCARNFRDLMLDEELIAKIHDFGGSVGAHTVNHTILSNCTDSESVYEITSSKSDIEKFSGRKCTLFAYPNGRRRDYSEREITNLKRANYLSSVTTVRGVNFNESPPYEIKRIGVYAPDSIIDIRSRIAISVIQSFFEGAFKCVG